MISTLTSFIISYKALNQTPTTTTTTTTTTTKTNTTITNTTTTSTTTATTTVTNNISQNLQKIILRIYGNFLNDEGTYVDYDGIARSEEFEDFQELTDELIFVNLAEFTEVERKVFFINLYNTCMIHAVTRYGTPTNIITRSKFFAEVGYHIGFHFYSLNDMEHGILRNNSPNASLGTLQFLKDDPRLPFIVPLDPRIHFALVCGAKSCPPIRVYTVDNVDRALDLAARNFCRNHVVITDKTVKISQIFKWYASDFGEDAKGVLEYVARFLEEDEVRMLEEMVVRRRMDFNVKYEKYDWSLNGS